LILHAETGSGKTLVYLLPITEQLWLSKNQGYSLILTPTRELAAQVAGIASVLAPRNRRLVSRPTNLMSDGLKDRRNGKWWPYGGFTNSHAPTLVGSARVSCTVSMVTVGMPASPTSNQKPWRS
jgi:hypothetical protein